MHDTHVELRSQTFKYLCEVHVVYNRQFRSGALAYDSVGYHETLWDLNVG